MMILPTAERTMIPLRPMRPILMTLVIMTLLGQSVHGQLIAHWPLGSDGQGTLFDGRSTVARFEKARSIQLGKEPFSISLWTHIDQDAGDTLGDLISCYDPKERRGFHLGIYNHGGVTNSQPNVRQVHFGIDQARSENEFTDHGQLGDAVYVFSLCVHDGRRRL